TSSPCNPLPPPTENEPVQIELTQRGYIRWLRQSGRSRRKEPGEKLDQLQENTQDLTVYTGTARLSESLLAFTGSGKAYTMSLADMPGSSGRDRGTPLVTLLSESAQSETIVAQFLPADYAAADRFVLLTQQGRLKWLSTAEFVELSARGLSTLKLKDNDQLQFVIPATLGMEVAIATSAGRFIRFPLVEVPEMGRPALGNQVVRLLRQETLVGLAAVMPDAEVVLVSRSGYSKRLSVQIARLGHPGGLGTPLMQFAQKSDALVAMVSLSIDTEVLISTNQNRVAYLPPQDLPLATKEGAGSLWVKLKTGEQIINVISVRNQTP
ncbi:MAG: DNA gyrase C-terminal beta-propeller domain-containing protein, partial [Thermosynechococcaceae cyanobacterium]